MSRDQVERFTFHHVSIKTKDSQSEQVTIFYSHSTMYLLKRSNNLSISSEIHDSHSTMYLLKPRRTINEPRVHIFTFHHVSIKTSGKDNVTIAEEYSHSTMYLLKPQHGIY